MAGGIAFRGHRRHSPSLTLPVPQRRPALGDRVRERLEARRRRTVAAGLERVVARAGRRSPGSSAALPIDRGEVLRARPWLLQLSERLREPGAVNPRGLAMVNRLLTDGASPILSPGWRTKQLAPGTLERQARGALAALDGEPADLPDGDRPRG